jgi:acetyl-CoA carboxylase biotin carboxylase subunit
MTQASFKKILVANRGEIALRVIHAIKELGYTSVIVHSAADQDTLPVEMADEAYLLHGQDVAETYLDQEQIFCIAKAAQVDAVHPGYGFLSENAAFAKSCASNGLTFIGPEPQTLSQLGDKIAAKVLAEQVGVPTIPGQSGKLPSGKKLKSLGEKIGYPLLVKAAAGGGGKGMRVVPSPAALEEAIAGAKREGQAYFGDDRVFLEKFIEQPRHIEVQILGDGSGNLIHLFERECSVQRRHQKMIEESPSPSIGVKTREAMGEAALRLAKAAGYHSAGTIEFIVDPQDRFYFLEVNTRLQVEHPITELTTGVDLVKAQIKIAEGHRLPLGQEDVRPQGHAIECRLYAEDPERDFLPADGRIGLLREPVRPGVRLDSFLKEGQNILSLYDPLLAKLCVHGANRKEALAKMNALLRDYMLLGVRHNLDFLRYVVNHPVFQKGHYHTHFVQEIMEDYLKGREAPGPAWLVAALGFRRPRAKASTGTEARANPLEGLNGFRNV